MWTVWTVWTSTVGGRQPTAWHAIIVRSGQVRSVQRGGAQVERDCETARLSTTALRPALMQLAHEYCALCNIACLFLASIGTQTAAAVMTYSRIGRPQAAQDAMRHCLEGI